MRLWIRRPEAREENSASEVTTLRRYTNLFIIIIIFYTPGSIDPRALLLLLLLLRPSAGKRLFTLPKIVFGAIYPQVGNNLTVTHGE